MCAWDVPRTDPLPAGRSPALLFARDAGDAAALLGQKGRHKREGTAGEAEGGEARYQHADRETPVPQGG